jgi:hypothetical protein
VNQYSFIEFSGGTTSPYNHGIRTSILPGGEKEAEVPIFDSTPEVINDVKNSYEVIKILFKDPLTNLPDSNKFYYKHDNVIGTTSSIPLYIQQKLDKESKYLPKCCSSNNTTPR